MTFTVLFPPPGAIMSVVVVVFRFENCVYVVGENVSGYVEVPSVSMITVGLGD